MIFFPRRLSCISLWTILVCISTHSFAESPIASVKPKSLSDAFQAALLQSETVGIQNELLYQTNEIDTQSKSALLPNISGSFTTLRQETPSSATGASISPSEQTTTKITLDQPLFRGFRDFAALRQKKHLVDAQYQAYLNAAKQLFYDLSTAYYNVLAFKQDEKNYLVQVQVNQKHLKELEGFYKIGRSKLTDVYTFKASIASLEVQLETTRGSLETAKDALAYLTGWSREVELEDSENVLSIPQGIALYLAKVEDRPDVKSATSNVKANEEAIPIAYGQHFPSADLLGNYYFARPGVVSNVNWDVSLAVTIPIFQGGAIQSQTRQAHSIFRQYNLLLSQTRRLAEQEIRTFHDAFVADLSQITKLKELVDVSDQNAKTNVDYFRNGLVTNLDVLSAITTFQDAQRQLDHQKYLGKTNAVKLQAATGQRKEIDVKPPESP